MAPDAYHTISLVVFAKPMTNVQWTHRPCPANQPDRTGTRLSLHPSGIAVIIILIYWASVCQSYVAEAQGHPDIPVAVFTEQLKGPYSVVEYSTATAGPGYVKKVLSS